MKHLLAPQAAQQATMNLRFFPTIILVCSKIQSLKSNVDFPKRTTSRRPQTTTSRARKVLQVPSTHRFSATTKIASSPDKAKQRPQKDDEAEELFHAVKKAALSEEQRSIKLLLEQGIAMIATSTSY